jgi:CDP-diacylglycerol--glycerol-3-phosphate 3-phosphatidyltransferase
LESSVRPNLPNTISLFRVAMVPVFMVFLLADVPGRYVVALGVFVVAAVSDWLDGYFARKRGQTTVLGAFLDPLADKLLITAALVSLVQLGELSAWAAMVVIARELAVTGLRMVAAARSVVISASGWGKVKTAGQMAVIVALIVECWLSDGWMLWGYRVREYLVIAMLVITVVSGVLYFVHAFRQPGLLVVPDEVPPQDRSKKE